MLSSDKCALARIFPRKFLTSFLAFDMIHIMKCDIYKKLLAWKSSPRRKPLLLQGARQTGKTFILKEFGRAEYGNFIYFIFDDDAGLDRFFQRDPDPGRILADLSTYKSLASYNRQIAPPALAQTSLLNMKKEGKILNRPLYAVSLLRRFGVRDE